MTIINRIVNTEVWLVPSLNVFSIYSFWIHLKRNAGAHGKIYIPSHCYKVTCKDASGIVKEIIYILLLNTMHNPTKIIADFSHTFSSLTSTKYCYSAQIFGYHLVASIFHEFRIHLTLLLLDWYRSHWTERPSCPTSHWVSESSFFPCAHDIDATEQPNESLLYWAIQSFIWKF